LSGSELDAQACRTRYDDGTYPDDFWDWLAENRHLLHAFALIALETKAAGLKRWSADAICHVLRWQTAMRERGQVELKINNNCTAGLARLTMRLYPSLEGFFVTRQPPRNQHGRRLIDGAPYHEGGRDR
jgi:hypothetical protein